MVPAMDTSGLMSETALRMSLTLCALRRALVVRGRQPGLGRAKLLLQRSAGGAGGLAVRLELCFQRRARRLALRRKVLKRLRIKGGQATLQPGASIKNRDKAQGGCL